MVAILALVFCASTLVFDQASSADSWKIITWGKNAPEWDQKLHVGGIRVGCSGEPAQCIRQAESAVRGEADKKVFLSVLLRAESPAEARQYSESSLQSPFLQEIGLDDFVARYNRASGTSPTDALSWLGGMVENVKSKNANLKFGITVYESDLSSPALKEDKLPARIRSKIDHVHLYLRYRANAPNYESYVQQAKSIFPKARVIAGAYAYDRISYIPCASGNPRRCAKDEELKLFMQALTTQIRLLKSQAVDWIEFYPGGFGLEQEMDIWETPRGCQDRQKSECVENTKAMRQAATAALTKELGAR